MDGKIRVFLADRTNEPDQLVKSYTTDEARKQLQSRSLRLEKASHIFDTEYVDTLIDELVNEIEIILKSVFRFLRVRNITAVADDCFANTAGLLRSIDAELQLRSSQKLQNLSRICKGSHVFCQELSAFGKV